MKHSFSPEALLALRLVIGVVMLVVVPLGLRLVPAKNPWLGDLIDGWLLPAGVAVVSLVLPRGTLAGVLCLPYLAATGALVVLALRARLWLLLPALACLPVAALALTSERFGFALFGFPMGLLLLTVAHFHVAGFGALLLVALLRSDREEWPARLAYYAAPVGVALVGAGFLIGRTALGRSAGDAVELVGAGVLTGGLWLAIGVAITARGKEGTPGRRFGTAGLGALALVTMSLAVSYAAGELFDIAHLDLSWMVLTHGLLNASAVLVAVVTVWALRTEPAWREQTYQHRIGRGHERFQAAATSLLRWDMHRGAGAWVAPETPEAVAGLRILSRLGAGPIRFNEPCRVLEAWRDDERAVMHYVALPGHVFQGDERFQVRIDAVGSVWLEVAVRSRPAWLPVRLAGPIVPLLQRLFIARCGRVLRRSPATREPTLRRV